MATRNGRPRSLATMPMERSSVAMAVVLPVPGPPVRTETDRVTARSRKSESWGLRRSGSQNRSSSAAAGRGTWSAPTTVGSPTEASSRLAIAHSAAA